jgi:hypothetical protein
MTFVYGWKMEVEVVMTPYEEVYKEIQKKNTAFFDI